MTRLAVGEMDRDDVEPARAVDEMMPRKKVGGEMRHPPLLPRRHGFAAVAECTIFPGLHFHEHDRLSVARDDVQFSAAAPVASRKNDVPRRSSSAHARSSPDFPSAMRACVMLD